MFSNLHSLSKLTWNVKIFDRCNFFEFVLENVHYPSGKCNISIISFNEYRIIGGKIATLRKGHRGSVFCLALNADAIVSGSFDHTICVWERQGNGKFSLVQRLNRSDVQHTDMIYGVAINLFNQIVSSSHDSTVSVWQYSKQMVS